MDIRIKAIVEYDGTGFSGWQIQKHGRTVQGEIEAVLCKRFTKEIPTMGSGRTDAGVHAFGQVMHFDCDENVDLSELKYSLCKMLPDDVRVVSLEKADPEFHARFDAVSRSYKYFISTEQNIWRRNHALHIQYRIDPKVMHDSIQSILGTHDFFPLSKVNADLKNYICTVFAAEVREIENGIVFYIRANRFMRGMVRLLMGTLLEVGAGRKDKGIFTEILETKDKDLVPRSAPAAGLFLTKVEY